MFKIQHETEEKKNEWSFGSSEKRKTNITIQFPHIEKLQIVFNFTLTKI